MIDLYKRRSMVCPIRECNWDTRGTWGGSPDMLCRGYGSHNPACLANRYSGDPEDLAADDPELAAASR